jgi:small subunit ribosomal protein S16
MVRIRFARIGTRNAPVHRIVAIDSRKARDGECIEILGTINKRAAESVVKLDIERIKFWFARGAQPTLAIQKLLARLGHGPQPKIPTQTKKHLPKDSK